MTDDSCFKMAEGSANDLTADQTDKLIQFQDLTGIEDIDRCRGILNRHIWNLEVAVQDTFNEREGAPSVFTQPPPSPPRTPPMNLRPTDQAVIRPSQRRPQGIFQWGYFLITLPFRFVYDSLMEFVWFALRLIRPDASRHVPDPTQDVMSFINYFTNMYGPTHPVFYQGSYSQAINDAKRELKFLLVYLHGDDHQDTPDFCRTTLCSAPVTEFLNTHLLFWGCNVNSREGSRVSQVLRENTYPFLALVVLRDNRMTVVARIEGFIEPDELIQRISVVMESNEASLVAACAEISLAALSKDTQITHCYHGFVDIFAEPDELIQRISAVMESNEASLVAARAEREERNLTQNLRQEQDVAYEESLRTDREKERKKREEREEKEREERKQREEDEELMMQVQRREELKNEYRREIPEEPSSDNPDSVRIMLKLPSGKRIERRFLKTHSLKYLYYYVLCHDDCPDSFTIVTNFPRRQLECEPTPDLPEPPSFQQFGLGKSEMLFVQDNEA